MLLHPEPKFLPLTVPPAILDTTVLVTWAVFVFHRMASGGSLPRPLLALIGARFFTLPPIPAYKILAARALLISFLPDIAIAVLRPQTWLYVFALMAMHIAAWAVCVTVMPALTRSVISPSNDKEANDATR
jgi:hypothetical protein